MAAQILPDLNFMRVDQVGSLLRPAKLKEAFAKCDQELIDGGKLRQVQDEAIRDVIATQEAHDLPVVTDGEYRRLNYMESFYGVGGFEGLHRWDALVRSDARSMSAPAIPMKRRDSVLFAKVPVTQRLRLVLNRPLEEYLFASRCTSRPVKTTLISTDRIVETFDLEKSRTVYSDVDEFLDDVVRVERRMVEEVVQAGCRYVQIDGPSYTSYVDPTCVAAMRANGEDPLANLTRSIKADNVVIDGLPGVTFGLHVCRGNRQSMWRREGFYDAIAECLFNNVHHQRLLLEYDTERAGNFEPLRLVPKGKIIVLGLITTKVGRVETVDELKRRIDDASRYIAIEQLALSPQCGFASDIQGNLLSEDEQWRKLDVMLETARQVWTGTRNAEMYQMP